MIYSKIIIMIDFLIIQILFFLDFEKVAEPFYIFSFALPLVLVLLFYGTKNCLSAKYLLLMMLFNWILFSILLVLQNKLALTLVLINVSFLVFMYMFVFIQHLFRYDCPCILPIEKKYCSPLLIGMTFILDMFFEHILSKYVTL